jgi:hypothetical protein
MREGEGERERERERESGRERCCVCGRGQTNIHRILAFWCDAFRKGPFPPKRENRLYKLKISTPLGKMSNRQQAEAAMHALKLAQENPDAVQKVT